MNKVLIHSNDRDSQIKIPLKTGQKIKYIKCRSLTIHNQIYNIDSSNNQFKWRDVNISTDITSVIPVGNYTETSLISELQTRLNIDKTAADSATYTVTLGVDKKVNITVSSGFFTVYTTGSISNILGFTSATTAGSITADRSLNMYYDRISAFLLLDINCRDDFYINKSVGKKCILGCIHLGTYDDILHYRAVDFIDVKVDNVNSHYTVSLEWSNGEAITTPFDCLLEFRF